MPSDSAGATRGGKRAGQRTNATRSRPGRPIIGAYLDWSEKRVYVTPDYALNFALRIHARRITPLLWALAPPGGPPVQVVVEEIDEARPPRFPVDGEGDICKFPGTECKEVKKSDPTRVPTSDRLAYIERDTMAYGTCAGRGAGCEAVFTRVGEHRIYATKTAVRPTVTDEQMAWVCLP